MPHYLQWPDQFANPTPMEKLGPGFTKLLKTQLTAGTTITVGEYSSSFAFARGERMVHFIHRGKLGYQGSECWEVLLTNRDEGVQLGSMFGIGDHACVVAAGIENIRAITELWLNGADIESVVDAVPLWGKINTREKLTPPAEN